MSLPRRIADLLLRPLVSAAARLRRRSRESQLSAHALALAPDGKVILVRLRYASGWRLPGGGRSADEGLADAALRELREEVGMTGHGRVRALPAIDPSLVLVEDVTFTPRRWSWEVERVIVADPEALPRGMSPLARRWIAALATID